jgi:hypothetical protein
LRVPIIELHPAASVMGIAPLHAPTHAAVDIAVCTDSCSLPMNIN